MNILLVNTNTLPPPIPPIGNLYLAGFLKRHSYSAQIINGAMIGDASPADLLPKGYSPDLIGFSIRNIDSVLMQDQKYLLPDAISIVDRVREQYPGTPIVLGGAGYSLEPMEIIEIIDADFGIVGEGEVPLLKLVQSLDNGGDFRDTPGLIYRTDSGYEANPPLPMYSATAEDPPLQAIELVDYKSFYDMCGMASSQTKRGCALKCTYCSYPVVEGRRFRLFPTERVVDELEILAAEGYDYIYFADSIFNAPRRHALDVCNAIIRRGLRIRWTSYTSPHGFDDELAHAFAESGCDGVDLGADGCSDKMLIAHGKTFKKRHIYRAAEACKKNRIEFALNILFGPPGENIETVSEAFQVADEIEANATLIGCGIRVYRHTPIHSQLQAMGKITAEQSMLKPYYYLSNELPPNFIDIIDQYALSRENAFTENVIRRFIEPSGLEPDAPLMVEQSSLSEPFRGPVWRLLRQLRSAQTLPTSGDQVPSVVEAVA